MGGSHSDQPSTKLGRCLRALEGCFEPLVGDEAARARGALDELRSALSSSVEVDREDRGWVLDLFELAPDGYLLTDTAGTVLRANHAAVALLGPQIAGRSLEGLVSPKQRETYRARLQALVSGRADRLQDWQLRMLPQGRAPVDIEATVEPLREGSAITGLRFLLRDVTERRKASEALRRSEARMRAILQAAVDGIAAIDARGRIESVNLAMERLSGYTQEELLGENISILMPSPFSGEHDGHIARYIETGERHIIGIGREVTLRRKDGRLVPIDLAVSEMRFGEHVGFVGILHDISNRREAEQAIEQERDFAQSLVQTAQAIVLVLDRRGRILRVNPYFEQLVERSAEDVEGADWFETFILPKDRDWLREVFARTLEGLPVHGNLNSIVTASGSTRLIEWHGTVLRDTAGAVTGVLALGQDITERRQLEEELRQAQKMEAIGQLAGGVAHDFNTLLGSILGYAELLQQRLSGRHPLQRAALQIERAAERGAALTRRLLAFSRPGPGATQHLDVGALLRGTEEMLQRLIPEDIQLRLDREDRLPAVEIDPTQLEQVLVNLVLNAADAMPAGVGRIEISASSDVIGKDGHDVRGAVLPPGVYVRIAVSDDGTGMDESTRSRVFEPFFTTKPPGKGTGLGLFTAYGIVRQAGGRITLDSELGKGTCFVLHLPESDKAVVAPAAVAGSPATGGDEKILVVEDDDILRELIVEVLEEHGYRVLSAADGDAALATSDEHGPADLLVTDVAMPGMNGVQLARRYRERFPEVPVLLVSGHAERVPESVADDPLAAGFLEKPFHTSDLLRALRELLDPAEESAAGQGQPQGKAESRT